MRIATKASAMTLVGIVLLIAAVFTYSSTTNTKFNKKQTQLALEYEDYQAGRSNAGLTFVKRSVGTWTNITGPWTAEAEKSKAIAVWRDDLYVGLVFPVAEIWRLRDGNWARVKKFANRKRVEALEGSRYLYATIDGGVWKFDGDSWVDLAFPAQFQAYQVRTYDNEVYAAANEPSPAIFQFVGNEWRDISEGLPEEPFKGVYDFIRHSDGKLYAGLISKSGPTAVYRRDDTWTKIGGDRLNGSWMMRGATYVESMTSHQGKLIVTMNRHPIIPGRFVSVWAWDGAKWYPVGAETAPAEFGAVDNFNASISVEDRLYITSGGVPKGQAAVWELTHIGWKRVGGNGLDGSWKTLKQSRHNHREYPYRLVAWNNGFLVGFGDAPGAAQLWHYQF